MRSEAWRAPGKGCFQGHLGQSTQATSCVHHQGSCFWQPQASVRKGCHFFCNLYFLSCEFYYQSLKFLLILKFYNWKARGRYVVQQVKLLPILASYMKVQAALFLIQLSTSELGKAGPHAWASEPCGRFIWSAWFQPRQALGSCGHLGIEAANGRSLFSLSFSLILPFRYTNKSSSEIELLQGIFAKLVVDIQLKGGINEEKCIKESKIIVVIPR